MRVAPSQAEVVGSRPRAVGAMMIGKEAESTTVPRRESESENATESVRALTVSAITNADVKLSMCNAGCLCHCSFVNAGPRQAHPTPSHRRTLFVENGCASDSDPNEHSHFRKL